MERQPEEILAEQLNGPTAAGRLSALRQLKALYDDGALAAPVGVGWAVNNHIHTTYSFSPYSPTKAAYMAWASGLVTAGIMDHDSAAGASEFSEAGRILGIATTTGIECRCTLDGTPFAGMKLNSPDQKSMAYLALHGIPTGSLGRAEAIFAPRREMRNRRNRAMVARINDLLQHKGVTLDFDRDVAPISLVHEGGSITERHLLCALAQNLIAKAGRGQPLVALLAGLDIVPPPGVAAKLLDVQTPYYEYHLIGLLKSSLVKQFYIPATEELFTVAEITGLANDLGAICAYAYLGDVTVQTAQGPQTQAFEDAFLDRWIPFLAASGFRGVTYMPSRSTPAQLARAAQLCQASGLFQISGEDINSPSQSFVCQALSEPRLSYMITSTWALIGHEEAASADPSKGMFAPDIVAATPDLAARIDSFAAQAKAAHGVQ